MGVFTFSYESTSSIPPARLFKALVLDADNLIPKVAPQAIESTQIVEGDGGAGTIKKVTFGQGSPYKNVTHKVEALDKENLILSYSVIESDAFKDKLEKITYEIKLVASGAGTVIKSVSHYYTKGDFEIKEEDANANKEKAGGLLKAVEAYLLANPDAYN
ncbi:hypothetical protein L6164_013613 [Bauhinia variegata]|uniref:Uncharacterized protein n=1 Tax=Bauhinia variegata TaxID=167791 RepID=A0ACB9NF90_BAUVA|nr:hypothetical protein L6164_013613 [Bauhinia variegata]